MDDLPDPLPDAGAPVSEAQRLSPGLYIVATPIGNLGDITRRAVATLSACDAVACEDTRVAGKLMKHLGLSKPLWRYDDHARRKTGTAWWRLCGTRRLRWSAMRARR
jgi:16S rRNA (cytidine1402-2'-O)-methyltransferase